MDTHAGSLDFQIRSPQPAIVKDETNHGQTTWFMTSLSLDITWCYNFVVIKQTQPLGRTFKTAWFARTARKARITDAELCEAIRQVISGQADDLGGGVFKKRLNKNMHRSIVVAKGGKYWVYAFLFAKKDRANIDECELVEFRKLAELYARKTAAEIARETRAQELIEICHDDETQV
jgi:hypothetical protein